MANAWQRGLRGEELLGRPWCLSATASGRGPLLPVVLPGSSDRWPRAPDWRRVTRLAHDLWDDDKDGDDDDDDDKQVVYIAICQKRMFYSVTQHILLHVLKCCVCHFHDDADDDDNDDDDEDDDVKGIIHCNIVTCSFF